MEHETKSAYEVWTWDRCRDPILSLKNRLGYSDQLWILGFEILDNGIFRDPTQNKIIYDPSLPPTSESGSIFRWPTAEMICLLNAYAEAPEIPLAGDLISLASLDQVRRPELTQDECLALLAYQTVDPVKLMVEGVPFFDQKLPKGDYSFVVRPLPRIPVTFILWHGDEDMPCGGTMLFDRTAPYYLGGLLRELGWLTIWRLRNLQNPDLLWGHPTPEEGV